MTVVKSLLCLLLSVALLAQDKPAPKPTTVSDAQPSTQEKSLGEVAREAKQQAKTPVSKVVNSDEPSQTTPGNQASTQEQNSVVEHFQEFASSHTQDETRTELQNWMHSELLKLLGNQPGDANKSNEQLIDKARKQSPDADSARIEQLLQQVREAGLLDAPSNQEAPPK